MRTIRRAQKHACLTGVVHVAPHVIVTCVQYILTLPLTRSEINSRVTRVQFMINSNPFLCPVEPDTTRTQQQGQWADGWWVEGGGR